jgi:hypothetical protein
MVTLSPAGPASAQYFDSGSTGADGAFSASCSPTPCTVTVTLPASGVFNYTTFTVPSGITVKYARNTANTPVTILATGDVTISGTIDVSGTAGTIGSASGTQLGPNRGPGGPGGFDGGNGANGLVATRGGNGLGPGGGTGGDPGGGGYRGGGGGGYLTAGQTGVSTGGAGGAAYGTPTLVPLVGGSGGAGGSGAFPATTGGGGGGGGGAILVASGTSATPRTITLSGSIKATGGNGAIGGGWFGSPPSLGGSGSGGAVRLMAHTIAGAGSIDVRGGSNGFAGNGGFGRTRLEAVSYTATPTFPGSPPSAVVTVATPALSPALPNHPTLTITSVGGVSAPGTLTGSFATPDFTLPADTSNPTVSFAASNIPLGTTLSVTVKGHNQGVISTATSSALSGTLGSSAASASVTIPTDQPSVISATASFTVIAGASGGPIYADGERVERVLVATRPGGGSDVTYVTVSGRELIVAVAR